MGYCKVSVAVGKSDGKITIPNYTQELIEAMLIAAGVGEGHATFHINTTREALRKGLFKATLARGNDSALDILIRPDGTESCRAGVLRINGLSREQLEKKLVMFKGASDFFSRFSDVKRLLRDNPQLRPGITVEDGHKENSAVEDTVGGHADSQSAQSVSHLSIDEVFGDSAILEDFLVIMRGYTGSFVEISTLKKEILERLMVADSSVSQVIVKLSQLGYCTLDTEGSARGYRFTSKEHTHTAACVVKPKAEDSAKKPKPSDEDFHKFLDSLIPEGHSEAQVATDDFATKLVEYLGLSSTGPGNLSWPVRRMKQLGRLIKRKVDNVFFYFVRSRDSNTTQAQSVEQNEGVKPSTASADTATLGSETRVEPKIVRDLLETLSEMDRLGQQVAECAAALAFQKEKLKSLRKALECYQ